MGVPPEEEEEEVEGWRREIEGAIGVGAVGADSVCGGMVGAASVEAIVKVAWGVRRCLGRVLLE
jgi:hypothetical protein